MKINKILYITPNYPLPNFPERGAFVETLIRGWKNCGVETDVIAPTALPLAMRLLRTKERNLSLSAKTVARPTYLTLSNKTIAGFDTKAIGEWSFGHACGRAFDHHDADAIIGKFLFGGARAAAKLGRKHNMPAFADIGESRSFKTLTAREKKIAAEVIDSLTGLYCVSDRLADEVVALGADPSRVLVAPNEADSDLFRPMDQQICRTQLGLPAKDYIVIFVGHLIERKGPLRLLRAIEQLGQDHKAIFVGRGDQIPTGNSVLHVGPILNSELPIWLNAADVFCLPTQAEGHCNAIEEAKACGLPVIASNIPSVVKQLDGHPAVLIDPNSINEIAQSLAAERMPLRNELRGRSGIKSADRSKKILNWLELRKES